MTTNNDDELIAENTDWFVRQITIKKGVPIDRLVQILRGLKTTGDLCVYMIEGGIRRIELHERTKATEDESEQIREILSIDDKTS